MNRYRSDLPAARRPARRRLAALMLAAALAAASGPMPGQVPVESAAEREETGVRGPVGELFLFVRPKERPGEPVSVRLLRIDALDADGAPIPVGAGPYEMRSDRGVGTGAALARGELPPGPYRALRLTLEPETTGGEPRSLEVDVAFRIEAERATTVFLAWDPAGISPGGLPAMAASVERPELRSLLIFVTNRGSDDVTVIRRDRDEVVGVVKVGREPMGIDTDPGGRKVYVANAGSDSVTIIDSLSRRVLDEMDLRFGARPVDLAVSRDGLRLFVASSDRATVTMYSTSSLQELAETEVGIRPGRLAVAPDGAVFVASEGSNSVSILDPRTLRPLATVPVESRPGDLAVDPRTGRVYVGHLGSDGVAVLGFGRTVERVLHFGGPVNGLTLDREGRRLYLSVGALDRLLFAQPEGENVTGFVSLPGPGRMALDPDGKKIYVVDPAGDRLRIVNRILVRAEGSIPTGPRPHDLVLLP